MSVFKIGVTGNIGAGKTQVCRIFGLLGIPVYFADPRAKDLMIKDPGLVASIKRLLGSKAYFDNGLLNREYVSSVVFSDRSKLELLNGLVHPVVAEDFNRWASLQKGNYCIKEAALLFESGSYNQLHKTILVIADKDKRLNRVVTRDTLAEEEVLARMDKQMPQEQKIKMADYIIDNNGNIGLVKQVLNLHKQLAAL